MYIWAAAAEDLGLGGRVMGQSRVPVNRSRRGIALFSVRLTLWRTTAKGSSLIFTAGDSKASFDGAAPRVLQWTRAEEKQRMRTRIETRRLILRPFEPADTEAAFGWFGDPVVMRFTVTGPDKSIEQTRTRLTFFEKSPIGAWVQ
jgi:Acetyltransferase (GNAT) domain